MRVSAGAGGVQPAGRVPPLAERQREKVQERVQGEEEEQSVSEGQSLSADAVVNQFQSERSRRAGLAHGLALNLNLSKLVYVYNLVPVLNSV